MSLNVKIKRLNENAVIPKYAHEFDAGFDLVATEDIIVEPGETVKVPTGLAFELPPGYEMQIRPRSGVTLKTQIRVQLGTVDSTYRGEVSMIVDNISRDDWSNMARKIDNSYVHDTIDKYRPGSYIIRKGDRIAQAVIKPVEHATFTEVETLGETIRGEGGFGSTGVNA